jgi:glycyl-tRNA synthetase beta subunit
MEIEYPGGKVFYDAPVMKIKNYSVKDLIDKRLLLLLPFYGFNFDKRFAAMETEGIEQLKAALEELNTSLSSLVESGDINEAQRGHLLDWTQRVLDKLTVRYKNVKKGVDDLMGGYIINTRTDAILKEGREQEQRERIEVMLRKGLKPEEVANYGDYPLALVKEVESNMLSLA